MVVEGTQQALLTFIEKIERLGLFQEDFVPPIKIDQVWLTFCRHARTVIETPVGALLLVDEDTREFQLRRVSPESQRQVCEKERLSQIECGSFGWVIERGRPALVPSMVLRELPSLFVLPLITAQQTLGAIFLFTPLSQASITQENHRLLTLLSKQCAMVIENALLYRKLTQEHASLLEAQKRAIEAEKLAALGRVTAGACHEILNPLNIISGHLQMARMEEDLPAMLDCNLDNMKQQADRISLVVKGLLHFSATSMIEKELVDINEILVDVIDHHSANGLEQPAYKITCRLDGQLGKIHGSSEALYQLFDNLLRNAREAMTAGGRLAVKSFIDAVQGDIVVVVEDDGIGIAAEDMPKVFEPFFTTKTDQHQIGLGLALAYGIVRNHGGDIRIMSKLRKGTTVQVRFTRQTLKSR
jgi:signal transduction histidine kinase